MKYFILPCLTYIIFGFLGNQQQIEFRARTSSLEYFIVITNGKADTIASHRADGTVFIFHANLKNSSIILENGRCDTATVSLFNAKTKVSTVNIPLESGEAMAIKDCFKFYETTNLNNLEDYLKWVYEKLVQNTKTYCTARKPSLMGGDEPNPEDPKMDIENTDYPHYLDWEDFNLDFKIYEGYPIKKISIISDDYFDKKRQLLFCAGEAEDTAQNYNWEGEIPAIERILEEQSSTQKGQKRFRIVGEKLAQHLCSPIKKGAEYQLAIYLKNDTSGHYYLHNFYLVTDEEKAFLNRIYNKK